MRHLEHVDAQPGQVARPARPAPSARRRPVSRIRTPRTSAPAARRWRCWARCRRRVRSVGEPGRRPERLQRDVADPPRHAVRRRRPASRPAAAAPRTSRGAVGRVEQRGAPRPRRPRGPSQHPGEPVDVVGVEVREHQQRHARVTPSRSRQRVHRRRVGAGVDHDRRCRRPGVEHQAVALPDVARRPAPSRAAASPASGSRTSITTSTSRPAAARGPCARRPSSRGRRAATDAQAQRREHGQRDRPGPPADRRRRAAPAPRSGDRDDPADAPAGRRPRPAARAAPSTQAEQPAGEPEHGRRRRRPARRAGWRATATRLTWPEIAATTRRAGQLRGQRHGDRLGRPSAAATARARRATPARAAGCRRSPAPTARTRP